MKKELLLKLEAKTQEITRAEGAGMVWPAEVPSLHWWATPGYPAQPRQLVWQGSAKALQTAFVVSTRCFSFALCPLGAFSTSLELLDQTVSEVEWLSLHDVAFSSCLQLRQKTPKRSWWAVTTIRWFLCYLKPQNAPTCVASIPHCLFKAYWQ